MLERRVTAALWPLFLLSSLAFGQLTYKTTFITRPGGTPGGLAVADFNRDGRPDLAEVHGSTVSVYLNQGSGMFGASHDTQLASGSMSVQAVAADVNNDGKVDLVIAQSQPMQIVVLLGNGDGTFRTPIIIPLANSARAIGLGDFNKDGKVDIAVRECPTSTTDCDIAVYLGNGNGTFALGSTLPAPGSSSQSQSLAVTDLNRDGNLDIATAALAGSSSSPTANFSVFFGKGDGTFGPALVTQVPFSVPSGSLAAAPSIVAGDLNGDAVDDIGVETGSICGGSACGQSRMNIFLNNGSGGFSLKGSFATSSDSGPKNWRAGDLNNDLKIDLVRIDSDAHTGSVMTWTNNGSGSFASIGNPYESAMAGYAELRDVNLDGRHDFEQADFELGISDIVVGLNGNGTPNCPPPPSNVLQAKMCSPGSTTSSTTFTVSGSGNSPVGIRRVELWVDGTKRAQTLDDQLRKTLTLAAGTHTITIVAVDQYLGFAKATRTVTVQ